MSDSTIVCNVSADVLHPYVPPSYTCRCIVFDSPHLLLHPGIQAVNAMSGRSSIRFVNQQHRH